MFKSIVVDHLCGDTRVETQHNPDLNSISFGCKGHNLGDHHSIIESGTIAMDRAHARWEQCVYLTMHGHGPLPSVVLSLVKTF